MSFGNLDPSKWTKTTRNTITNEICYTHIESKDIVSVKPAAIILDELKTQLESINKVYKISSIHLNPEP